MPKKRRTSLGSGGSCPRGTVTAYHGGNAPIRKFAYKYSAQGIFWFSENKDKILKGESGAASTKYLMTACLDVKKPAGWSEYDRKGIGELKQEGFDSVHLDDDWAVFSSKSIKVVKVEPR